MYKQIEKDAVFSEMNNGAVLYAVDIPTGRIMECANMTYSAVKSFVDKPEVMFFKEVKNE